MGDTDQMALVFLALVAAAAWPDREEDADVVRGQKDRGPTERQ